MLISSFSKAKNPLYSTDIRLSEIGRQIRKNQLAQALLKTVETVKKACGWFWAYIGSKDGSIFIKAVSAFCSLIRFKVEACETGYERSVRRALTSLEMMQCAAFSAMAAFAHCHDESYLTPFGLRYIPIHDQINIVSQQKLHLLGFEFNNATLLNVKLGIKLTLLQAASGNFYLAFGDAGAVKRYGCNLGVGEDCFRSEAQAKKEIYKQLTVGNTMLMSTCSKAVSLLLEDLSNQSFLGFHSSKVTFTGQCYGGMLSSYCALDLGCKAVTLNAVAFGAQSQIKLGKKLIRAKELLTHLFVEGDWTQSLPAIEAVDWLFSRLGFRTPGCFGKKFEIPNCHKLSLIERHIFSLDLILGNLGYPKRTHPKDLLSDQVRAFQNCGFDDFSNIK